MDLHGCNVAFSTTNGTVAILKAVESNPLFVGAFANLSALADAIPADRPLVILCSGWKGDPSIEDTLFAGALIKRLQQRYPDATLVNDAAIFDWRVNKFNVSVIIKMYELFPDKPNFFNKNNMLEKLVGYKAFRKQIENGVSEEEIRSSWSKDLENFKEIRSKYLIYS